jgi:hypothetical protein
VKFDDTGNALDLVEKPREFLSNWAITGLVLLSKVITILLNFTMGHSNVISRLSTRDRSEFSRAMPRLRLNCGGQVILTLDLPG